MPNASADCRWEIIPVELPLRQPLRTAKGDIHHRQLWLLRLQRGEIQGWGEASPLPGFGGEAPKLCLAALGKIPGQARSAYDYASAIASTCPAAASAIRGALADASARAAGLPLARHLAAACALRPCTRLRLSLLLEQPDPEAALSAFAAGWRVFKWKSSGDIVADAAAARALRATLGPDAGLRLDANGRWSVDDCRRFAELSAEVQLDWVEQPLAPGKEADLAELTSCKLRVALDESLHGLDAVSSAAQQYWAEVFIWKYQWLGGFPALRAGLRLAQGHHPRRVVLSSTLDSWVGRSHALHAAAALGLDAEAHGLATGHLLAKDLGPDHALNGHWQLGDGPGLGGDPQL
ncbi:MAG: hypothetical protein EA402_14725 [Planctomycetota bacterium]|nr:MAG: hypothetical protein EA402_14725 [Planctomycetota bacterium]